MATITPAPTRIRIGPRQWVWLPCRQQRSVLRESVASVGPQWRARPLSQFSRDGRHARPRSGSALYPRPGPGDSAPCRWAAARAPAPAGPHVLSNGRASHARTRAFDFLIFRRILFGFGVDWRNSKGPWSVCVESVFFLIVFELIQSYFRIVLITAVLWKDCRLINLKKISRLYRDIDSLNILNSYMLNFKRKKN